MFRSLYGRFGQNPSKAASIGSLVFALSVGSVCAGVKLAGTEDSWDYNWDQMEHVSKKREKGLKPSRHVIMIRHGQYSYVSKDLFPCGSEESRIKWDSENKLTQLGQEQARLTGKRLADLFQAKGIDALWYSDQKRATETANIIHEELKNHEIKPNMHMDQMLREGNPIKPVPGSPGYEPSSESIRQDGARIEAAFRKHIHRAPLSQKKDTYEVLVCHGNVIRYFVCKSLQMNPEAWLRLAVYNCGITTIRITHNGKVSISNVGDTGHIPPEKVTYS
mmetsp:Transcript_6178/g.9695  ORF Transcript_6178/g.9695 Transcript_6178/m.9695 type:complete len:277 (-) Transcript_6178:721-1551(-)